MLTRNEFTARFAHRVALLDGATGTNLMAAGMPRGVCQEKWIIDNPDSMLELQRKYAAAGSEIIYAPTFQANVPALKRYGLEGEAEGINADLVKISRKAAPGCLIAGNVTTLRGHMDTGDEKNLGLMTEIYARQLRALKEGGADIIAAETLMHPLEAKAILEAAKGEGIFSVMVSFPVKPDGRLYSGHEAAAVFAEAEKMGAAAIGINCTAADENLPGIIEKLRKSISAPFICKPNTGRAVNGVRPVDIHMFTDVMRRCIENGANLVGGCCGTTPEHIAALREITA